MDRRKFLGALSGAPLAATAVLRGMRLVDGPHGFVLPDHTLSAPLDEPLIVATELSPVRVTSVEGWITDADVTMTRNCQMLYATYSGDPVYRYDTPDIRMTLQLAGLKVDDAFMRMVRSDRPVRVYFETGG